MLNSRGTCSPQRLSTGQQTEVRPVLLAFVCYDLTEGSRDWGLMWTCVSCPLNSGLKATLDEAPDSSDGPGISLVFPPIYEGDEAWCVQAALCSGPAVSRSGLQPRLLEAEPGWRPPGWIGPQKQADEVPGCLADPLEVIPGKAEV